MAHSNQFLIVALGASAGGLEALEKFFTNMPDDAGIAFVVVQHLAPDHTSALPELLARCTRMVVEQVRENTKAVPNEVYIIPPNATLTIKDGVLHVEPPAEPRGLRKPIDSLFSSLSEDCGENAVCIMLSGTGTDGTLGLKAIKEHDGMAMVQTPESAKYDPMLRSAIATGLVDHVLPVEEMPAKLLEYAAHLSSLKGTSDSIREQASRHFGKIHDLLRRTAGHDFSQYKEATVSRRLERRMRSLQIETVERYIQVLERQPEECDRLFKDLLIGVTHFFRDPAAFAALGREVVPKLFEGKGAGDRIRVCVAGCASGEEAYSIGILLCEHASTLKNTPKIQIFATDIDERGLEVARKGCYPESIAEQVDPERLERFFIKQDNGYQVKRALREIIIFSSHSFIKDPPFSRLDLISCRNVMIYLGLDLQQKVIPLFHYALRTGGYLFLGPSENISTHRHLFQTMDKEHRIFQRKESLPLPTVRFPLTNFGRPKQSGGKQQPQHDERNLPKQLERIILEQYGPACVIVKENGQAVYFSGRISRYLQHPAGSPETNVLNMAREGLRIPLRTSLHKTVTARERVVQKQISVQTNGSVSQVDLTVEPLAGFQDANLYMILLQEVPAANGPQHDGPAGGSAGSSDDGSAETILHLESELLSAQQQAQAAYEELETSNEELQSSNEEFQSTNEELETSKEELQSSNEELETVNAELNRKVAELDNANSDLQNLLESTQIATIFLDWQLRIKSFTPAAGAVFRLIGGDTGRPITDLASQFADVDFVPDIKEVLRTLVARERQLAGAGGRHYQMRILPYRTVHNAIDGVVLTFTDVTQIKEAEQLAEDAQTYAENIVDTVREPLLVLDAGLRVKSGNKSFFRTFGVIANETIDQKLYELGNRQWDIPELRRLLTEVLPEEKNLEDFQVEHEFPDVGRKSMLLNARQIQQQNGKAPLILLAIDDITAQKRAGEALRQSEERYRTLFEATPVAVFVCDSSAVIQDYNHRAQQFWGRAPKRGDPAERYCGSLKLYLPDGTLLPDQDSPMAEVLRTGIPARNVEVFIARQDASRIPVMINFFPLTSELGKITGVIASFDDITELKRAQEVLRRLNVDLKQFAYATSHDLQEPLRMVTSYTQLLARQYKGKLDRQADQFIAYAVEGAQRMETLLRDLREYWWVNDQKIEQNGPVDCNRVLEKVLANLEAGIQESGAVVTHDPLPTVIAEELPLVLLFQNLIGNAIKYHRSNEPAHVHILARRKANLWTFSVHDSGIGIEAEYLEVIFAPFKRLHGKEYPGTGLGLAICQKIVERYGGWIWVESAYGEGSTFYFTFSGQGVER